VHKGRVVNHVHEDVGGTSQMEGQHEGTAQPIGESHSQPPTDEPANLLVHAVHDRHQAAALEIGRLESVEVAPDLQHRLRADPRVAVSRIQHPFAEQAGFERRSEPNRHFGKEVGVILEPTELVEAGAEVPSKVAASIGVEGLQIQPEGVVVEGIHRQHDKRDRTGCWLGDSLPVVVRCRRGRLPFLSARPILRAFH
jgi:hypothetical protein